MIHLADDEWGNSLMQEIAETAIANWKGPGELVVEVYEHAGWHLAWARIDGQITCVSSANDCAQFPKKIKQFWSDFNRCEREKLVQWVAPIRRESEKEEKVAA
jgi:hypothetical protein